MMINDAMKTQTCHVMCTCSQKIPDFKPFLPTYQPPQPDVIQTPPPTLCWNHVGIKGTYNIKCNAHCPGVTLYTKPGFMGDGVTFSPSGYGYEYVVNGEKSGAKRQTRGRNATVQNTGSKKLTLARAFHTDASFVCTIYSNVTLCPCTMQQ